MLESDNEKPKLILYNGKIINIYGEKINNFNFDKTIFDLSKYITKSTIVFKIQELSTKILIDCYVNYHLLKNKDFFDLLICNDASLNATQEELSKRIIKPLYYFCIAMCVCFLLLFSKEKSKYKLYRTNIFLFWIYNTYYFRNKHIIIRRKFYKSLHVNIFANINIFCFFNHY